MISWIVGSSEIEFVGSCGDLMVSMLVSRLSGPGSNLVRDIVLCSWARHFTLIVPLSPQVYMGTGEPNAGDNPVMA